MLKIRAITNLILVAAMIFISYYSSIVGINGETQASVSQSLSTAFTPAPYAFSIWGIIFVMLVVVAIKDIRLAFLDNAGQKAESGWSMNCWLTVAIALTIVWVIVWSYLQIGLSVINGTAQFTRVFQPRLRRYSS